MSTRVDILGLDVNSVFVAKLSQDRVRRPYLIIRPVKLFVSRVNGTLAGHFEPHVANTGKIDAKPQDASPDCPKLASLFPCTTLGKPLADHGSDRGCEHASPARQTAMVNNDPRIVANASVLTSRPIWRNSRACSTCPLFSKSRARSN